MAKVSQRTNGSQRKAVPEQPNPSQKATAPQKASAPQKERLDVALVTRGLVPTREKAARLVLAGQVQVDGKRVDKAGTPVASTATLEVTATPFVVSRGGLKLAPALDTFGVNPQGRICVDIGASTGGFTQCLLERGAVRVYAVDVGHGQLDATLRADGRVVVMEKTNARHLTPTAFAEAPHLATVDVSFISLEKVLPALANVLAGGGEVVALVKPQFEVGKGQVGSGGVVRDPTHHKAVLDKVARFAILHGWHVLGVTSSPLRGPKGNREFFLHLTKTGRTRSDLGGMIESTVAAEPAEPA